jgi:hypothetical protein
MLNSSGEADMDRRKWLPIRETLRTAEILRDGQLTTVPLLRMSSGFSQVVPSLRELFPIRRLFPSAVYTFILTIGGKVSN